MFFGDLVTQGNSFFLVFGRDVRLGVFYLKPTFDNYNFWKTLLTQSISGEKCWYNGLRFREQTNISHRKRERQNLHLFKKGYLWKLHTVRQLPSEWILVVLPKEVQWKLCPNIFQVLLMTSKTRKDPCPSIIHPVPPEASIRHPKSWCSHVDQGCATIAIRCHQDIHVWISQWYVSTNKKQTDRNNICIHLWHKDSWDTTV